MKLPSLDHAPSVSYLGWTNMVDMGATKPTDGATPPEEPRRQARYCR